MIAKDNRQIVKRTPRWPIRDLPGCIKYILLILLILLLVGEIGAGEFNRPKDMGWLNWVILFIKLILIAGLLALIWVQGKLECNITDPTGCATTEYDPATDKLIIRVKGTARGWAFGHYTLAVELGGWPFPMPVSYPGGGSNGSAPVLNGELGQLDVTGVDPSPGFTVILTVYPAGPGATATCSSNFNIFRKMVYIDEIGAVPARVIGPHPDDPSEALKLVKENPDPPLPAPPGPEISVAEGISVVGGADVYGCGRQMSEYVLQYREVHSGQNPWQQDAPNTATSTWNNINAPLPFGDATHPRTYTYLGTPLPNYVLNGKLTRQWALRSILQSLFPLIYANRWVTVEAPWYTNALNGRFTVRLRVKHQPLVGPPDPTPPELYDAATLWVDNRPIDGKLTGMSIAGGATLGGCDALLLSYFVTSGGTKVNAEINGRAWDPIILDSYPHTLKPNDNFGAYELHFEKDGTSSWLPITTSITRVPNILQASPLPALPAGTGMLASWDIVAALDAGPLPPGPPVPPPYPKIYRGQRCAYLIQLYVHDTTHRADSGVPHYLYDYWPFCIMNDLTDKVPYPVPA